MRIRNYKNFIGLIAAGVLLLIACKKDYNYPAKFNFTNQNAYIKIIHVSPNFRAIHAYPDSFDVYVADRKINSGLITYNTYFPVTTLNTNTYAAVPAGAQQIRLTLRGVNKIDSVAIISIQKDLTPGYYYTLFITDSLQTQQLNTKIWVMDDFPKPDTGQYAVRFAHMILNDTAGKTVDVYSYRQARNIFSGVAPGTVTPFITLPFTRPVATDTFSIRRTGTGYELARINSISITNNQRVYTAVYKGVTTITGAITGIPGITGTNVRARSGFIYNNR